MFVENTSPRARGRSGSYSLYYNTKTVILKGYMSQSGAFCPRKSFSKQKAARLPF
jgi:hypothetical protein